MIIGAINNTWKTRGLFTCIIGDINRWKTRGLFTCIIGVINTWKIRGSFTCIIGGIITLKTRVCAFNLFYTCIPRGKITHIPRVFHVAVPAGLVLNLVRRPKCKHANRLKNYMRPIVMPFIICCWRSDWREVGYSKHMATRNPQATVLLYAHP